MRIKEWYSWHFPELARIITDNQVYVRLIDLFGNKLNVTDELLGEIQELTVDGEIAQ